MAVIDDNNEESLVVDGDVVSSLREERKQTMVYITAGGAIFLCLLGLHSSLIQGNTEYFFVSVILMFVYIIWIFYASKKQMKNKDIEKGEETEQFQEWNECIDQHANKNSNEVANVDTHETCNALDIVNDKDNIVKDNVYMFSRSYSIA